MAAQRAAGQPAVSTGPRPAAAACSRERSARRADCTRPRRRDAPMSMPEPNAFGAPVALVFADAARFAVAVRLWTRCCSSSPG